MRMKFYAALLSLALAGALTGCTDTELSAYSDGNENVNIADRLKETNTSDTSVEFEAEQMGLPETITTIVSSSEAAAVTQPVTASTASTLEFTASKPEITISKGGNYTIKGSTANGRLIISAGTQAVTITLSDVNITSERGPALRIRSAKSVTINLPKDTNNVLSSTAYDDDSAAISSFADITVSGEGSLTLSSNGSGLDSERIFNMKGGSLTVQGSEEGIEASQVNVSGGTISITSREDGINVDGAYNTEKFNMTGGKVYINCGGDGLDSRVYVSGGTLIIEGSTRYDNYPIEFERNFEITGGTIITTGSSLRNIRTAYPTGGTQTYVAAYINAQNGDTVSIKDSDGNEIASLIPAKAVSAIFVSNSLLVKGDTYTVSVTDAQTGVTSKAATVKAGSNAIAPQTPQATTPATPPAQGTNPPYYYDDDYYD
ncbi:MAG: carbohydrate-binding domain-containing protein, partial [Ruminococcus sp.]|nr:carbohydrate-binding domain-containing protein [Ruminococcus sp.]